MLRLSIKSFINNSNIRTRACSTASAEKWDLFTAVCLERKPVIVPEMNDIEKQFSKQLSEIELEKSFKSPHEIRHENDLKQLELLKKGEVDVDISLKQTAQDFADASLEELNNFKLTPRNSDPKKDSNLKSLERKLDKHLVLLTEQKIGGKKHFLLPQAMRQDGETLRQTAERVLREYVGKDIKAQIYGNAPSGFYKYKYPKTVRNEKDSSVGAKIFIYFARYNNGELTQKIDYKWVDRNELSTELPKKYNDSLQQLLIDE